MVLRALLVEDNRIIRENLIPTLEALSQARIEGVAESEAEAIAWLNSHAEWDVDCLVLRKEGQPARGHFLELRH
jgi:two-component system OmpR family response regulator